MSDSLRYFPLRKYSVSYAVYGDDGQYLRMTSMTVEARSFEDASDIVAQKKLKRAVITLVPNYRKP